MDEPKAVRIQYTNHRGEFAVRHVVPLRLYWGSNGWHPEPTWLMDATDLDKNAERTFALQDVHQWQPCVWPAPAFGAALDACRAAWAEEPDAPPAP